MFAVIFEARPRRGSREDYLELAARLRPELEQVSGFITIERFANRAKPGQLLSLSFWYNEKALIRWRTLADHHHAQRRGRDEIFADYRLRVGEVTGDTYSPADVMYDGRRADETEVSDSKVVTIARTDAGVALPAPLAPLVRTPPSGAPVEFESIANPGKLLWLSSWREAAEAAAWEIACRRELPPDITGIRIFRVRIIRDYGLFDRREAPQYYPPVPARPKRK